ncbi:MAG: hypothetical protein QOF78_1082 [Phycisphaerales bacterium]|nr:hypothetical protein [Phycisphaerales bacterium]
MNPPPMPVIEYDTPRADQVSRRKYFIAFGVAAVLGALLFAVLMLGVERRSRVIVMPRPVQPSAGTLTISPSAAQAQAQAEVQKQIEESRKRANEARLRELLVNRLGPQKVVYEEEPVAARKYFGQGVCNHQTARRDISMPFFSAFEPPVYRTDGFWDNNNSDERDALLFSHQLTSKSGNVRLVMLEMEVKLDGTKLSQDEYKVAINRKLKYRICEPKLLVNTPNVIRHGTSLTIAQDGDKNVIPIKWVEGTLRSARPTENNLRFFAGQPDPQDPSHFTIDYEVGGVKSTIDGWLTDDDFLRILPRGGAVDHGNWRIDGGK